MAIVESRKRRRRKKHRPRHHKVTHAHPKPKPTPKKAPAVAAVVPVALATTRERLFLNRFGTGFTQAALARMRASGSPEAWLSDQLDPTKVAESSKVAQGSSWVAPLTA